MAAGFRSGQDVDEGDSGSRLYKARTSIPCQLVSTIYADSELIANG